MIELTNEQMSDYMEEAGIRYTCMGGHTNRNGVDHNINGFVCWQCETCGCYVVPGQDKLLIKEEGDEYGVETKA